MKLPTSASTSNFLQSVSVLRVKNWIFKFRRSLKPSPHGILSAQTIRKYGIVTPFHERTKVHGLSFGLSSCGYDVRIAEDITLGINSNNFFLASTMEHFDMPDNVVGRVCDKSTWARKGIAVQNTIIEPGWRGYLTLEISSNHKGITYINKGMPIAQVVFEFLDEPTEQVYEGKYQDQPEGPVYAKFEL